MGEFRFLFGCGNINLCRLSRHTRTSYPTHITDTAECEIVWGRYRGTRCVGPSCGVHNVHRQGRASIYIHIWRVWKILCHFSRLMPKPTQWSVRPARLGSAWAFAQSDWSLRCPWFLSYPFLSGCPGWSFCWFCHEAAHIRNKINR